MITPDQIAKAGTEHSHQVALFVWAQQSGIPELKWMFAIPNGGQRTAVAGARLKAEGVKAGVPDIFLPIYRRTWSGLWIELKKPKGVVSDDQNIWLDFLATQEYCTRVCWGWEEARNALLEYLGKI